MQNLYFFAFGPASAGLVRGLRLGCHGGETGLAWIDRIDIGRVDYVMIMIMIDIDHCSWYACMAV